MLLVAERRGASERAANIAKTQEGDRKDRLPR